MGSFLLAILYRYIWVYLQYSSLCIQFTNGRMAKPNLKPFVNIKKKYNKFGIKIGNKEEKSNYWVLKRTEKKVFASKVQFNVLNTLCSLRVRVYLNNEQCDVKKPKKK